MKNVLIYNQSETNMEVLKIFLAQEGYQVYVVSRLEDVIRRVGQKDIHLVVMDIDFPQNDGVERLKEIRNTDRMPIIVLSANDREQMKIAALNAGADDYVIYPFHPLEFMARINSQFRRYIQLVNMRNNIDRIYRVDDLVMNDAVSYTHLTLPTTSRV